MKQAIFPLLQISICTFCYLYATCDHTLAQITSDGTVNTQVNQNGNISEITGGQTRESNLFHSFQDFSVGTGNEAWFNNANDISNIFSRVTGENISNIDGAIRANGSASLFLINPAGIIFGENASLNIGGSFYGSTASSILFKDGEFSAADLENPPLLTVNAPIGLGFRDNPGDINIQASNLRVAPGQKISLLGKDINISDAYLEAIGGKVNLSAISAANTVTFNENFNFNISNTSLADIQLNNGAIINVNGAGGGEIIVNSRNLTLSNGSIFNAGIFPNSSEIESQAGDIRIRVSESLVLESASLIRNNVNLNGFGNAGNIEVTAQNLSLMDNSRLSSISQGNGNSGNIKIAASDRISLENSNIQTRIIQGGVGNAGNVEIITSSLELIGQSEQNSFILTDIFGQGNAGNAIINAQNIFLNDSAILSTLNGEGNAGNVIINAEDVSLDNSDIQAKVRENAEGNAGNIEITTKNLSLLNDSLILSDTQGIGNAGKTEIISSHSVLLDNSTIVSGVGLGDIATVAQGEGGDISIATNSFSLENGSRILANVEQGQGSAGNVIINAKDVSFSDSAILSTLNGEGSAGNVIINAEDLSLDNSDIQAKVRENAKGNAGNIEITTTNFSLLNDSVILSDTQGIGNAGKTEISASNSVLLDNSTIVSGVGLGDITTLAQGNGGDILISADLVSFQNRSQILANVENGQGNAGNVVISANDVVLNNSDISSTLDGKGNSGDINITATNLNILNNSEINVSAFGDGDGGNVFVQTNFLNLDQGRIVAVNQPSGSNVFAIDNRFGGNITLELAEQLSLRNDSLISSQAGSNASGGNISIDTKFIIAFPNGNNDILASAQQGRGGSILINTESLLGISEGIAVVGNGTNDIDASSEFSLDGNVTINTPDINPIQGTIELPTNIVVPEQTTAQACQSNREIAAKNGLTIKGKGGIPVAPDLPLSSRNISLNGESANSTSLTPLPLETSQGKIQPARGIKITEDGKVILTAYRTNNLGERIPEGSVNCDRV